MADRDLFRGKRLDNGEWVKGAFYDDRYIITSHDDNGGFDSNRELVCNAYEVDPATVGRCTGLRDKNGKLIFEGDIILSTTCDDEPEVYRVAFEKYSWEMRSPIYDYQELRDFVNDYTTLEIIGNIHDNPELLREGLQEGLREAAQYATP